MQKKQLKKVFVLLLFSAMFFSGCKKDEPEYVKVDTTDSYSDLDNVSIFSLDDSSDESKPKDTSTSEEAITEGGSTDKKPTPTLTPTPKPTSSASGSSSGGSSGGGYSGGGYSGGGYSSGGSSGGSSSGRNTSGGSTGSQSGGSSASIGSTNGESVIGNLKFSQAVIANKSGVVVIAKSASEKGIHLSLTNNNSCAVTVYIHSVRVNNILVNIDTTIKMGKKSDSTGLIPLTDNILKQYNITKITNISVSVDITKHQTATATPKPTKTPTPKPTNTPKPKAKAKATATPVPSSEDTQEAVIEVNPTTAPVPITGNDEEEEHTTDEDIIDSYDPSDYGELLGSMGNGIEIYGKYIYTGYESRFVITTVNNSGSKLKIKAIMNYLLNETENTFPIYDGVFQNSLIYSGKCPLITGEIIVYDKNSEEEIGSTGGFSCTYSK